MSQKLNLKPNGWYFNPDRKSMRWNGVGVAPIWFNELIKKGMNPDDFFIEDDQDSQKIKNYFEKNVSADKFS